MANLAAFCYEHTVVPNRNANMKPKILVVDDEVNVAGVLASMLRRLGASTTIAIGGQQALEALNEESCEFDIVITDLTMPGMTGVDLAV